jgi:hypothetical protein
MCRKGLASAFRQPVLVQRAIGIRERDDIQDAAITSAIRACKGPWLTIAMLCHASKYIWRN